MGPKGPKAKVSLPRPLTNRSITLSDSESDGYECAAMAMANPIPKGKFTSYRDMTAIPGTTLQPGFWIQRPADDQHSEGELHPSKIDMMTIEGSPDGKSPPDPNSSTTINPKDPYGKPFTYEVESLEYGQSKDMVTTTAEHTSDRSSTQARVFDSDSGSWYVPGVYTPTDVSLGNVPGYDNYIAPEPKETVEPARTRSKTRASKFVLPSSIEPPSSEEDVDHDECETHASSGDDAPSQPVLLRKVLATSQSVRTSSNPNTPANRSVRMSPCISSLAGAKPLHGQIGRAHV
jgi:hypothetical protein